MNKNSPPNRTGAVIPLLAILISAIFAIVALTINSSWIMYNRINAQNTADLAARSALVKVITDTKFNGRLDRARELAVRMYELNIDREAGGISPERIRFGTLADFDAFEPEFIETNRNRDPISAVQVDTPTEARERSVKVFLGEFLGGRHTVDIVSDATASTLPLDLYLCLDASRSMNMLSTKNEFPRGTNLNTKPGEGSRWFELVETVELFIAAMQEVNPNARVGLVTFGGGAPEANIQRGGKGVRSALDKDHARLEQSLELAVSDEVLNIPETLESYVTDNPALGLGTSIYDGLRLSVENFDDQVSSKHIILLSDGQQAIVDRPSPVRIARDASDENITVHTIAFASNVPDLVAIAEETGGTTFRAASDEELKEAFAALLGRFRTQLVD